MALGRGLQLTIDQDGKQKRDGICVSQMHYNLCIDTDHQSILPQNSHAKPSCLKWINYVVWNAKQKC